MKKSLMSLLSLALVAGIAQTASAHVPMPEYVFRNRELLAVLENNDIGVDQTVQKLEFKGRVAGIAHFSLTTNGCTYDGQVEVRALPVDPEAPVHPLVFSSTLSECQPAETGPQPSGGISSGGTAPAHILFSRVQIRTMLESDALRDRITYNDALQRIELKSVAGAATLYEVESEHCRATVTLKQVPNSGPMPKYTVSVGQCF